MHAHAQTLERLGLGLGLGFALEAAHLLLVVWLILRRGELRRPPCLVLGLLPQRLLVRAPPRLAKGFRLRCLCAPHLLRRVLLRCRRWSRLLLLRRHKRGRSGSKRVRGLRRRRRCGRRANIVSRALHHEPGSLCFRVACVASRFTRVLLARLGGERRGLNPKVSMKVRRYED